jgi:hypothetical protein
VFVERISPLSLVASIWGSVNEGVEALAISIADLELGPVVSAWGAQSVREILPSLSGVGCHLAVRGSKADSVRLFRSAQLLRADPSTMLDLLPGGQQVAVIEADTLVSRLPNQRPLAVVSAGELIGVLLNEHAPPVRGPQPKAVINAGEIALREVKRAMAEFRRKGVPLIIDVRDSRVHGSADVLTDLLQTLLADILEHVERTGGAGAAHVMLSPGRSGTWLVVEDRCGRLSDEVQVALADPGAWCEDPLVRSFRRLKERVEDMGGSMSAQPGPFGMRTLVALPGPGMPSM